MELIKLYIEMLLNCDFNKNKYSNLFGLSYVFIGDRMEYKVNKPYPEIRVEQPNLEYAKLLLEDYAGTISEDTAVHLYLYQHLVADDLWEYYSKIIENISVVEMHHLEILGKLIKLLGLDPAFVSFKDDRLVAWTANYVNYTTDLETMLDVDIMSETKAIQKYREHVQMIDDVYIKQILLRIIEDEEIHLDIFKKLKELLKKA